MSSHTNIVILGTGAIGGYYGGNLSAFYSGSENIRIHFIARGKNLKAIYENGLKLITNDSEHISRPFSVTDNPADIGPAQLILICVKSYDLESAIENIKPCISEDTVLLPLLNGVDACERIKNILPGAEVWNGCVYLVSRLIAPGVVKDNGVISHLYFGSENASPSKLKNTETIFTSAGIAATYSENILKTIWEKFLFISPLASATSYFDMTVGSILENSARKNILLGLISELKNVADATGIILSGNITKTIIEKISSLPFETTSSMHSDFQKGNKTEVESLTGFVTRLGKKLDTKTPFYDLVFAELKSKSN